MPALSASRGFITALLVSAFAAGACGGDGTASSGEPTSSASSGGATPSSSSTGAAGRGGGGGGGGTAGNGGAGAGGAASTGGAGGAGGEGAQGGQGGAGAGTGGVSTGGSGGGTGGLSGSGGAGGNATSSASSSSSAGTGGGTPGVRVRILTGNLTSGTNQSYDPGQGIRIFQGLHPDIALVQELNYGDGSQTAIRAFVDTAFGPTFDFQRENTAGLPNGIVSRFPIVDKGVFVDPDVTNRSFVWARIDVPGPNDLWAVSVHLLTTSADARNTEATALLADLAGIVPAGEMVVVGGDFNTKVRTEPCLVTLGQRFDIAAPFPVDQAANDNTNGPRTRPYDWLLLTPGLDAAETSVVIGAQSFPGGLVFDSQVYSPLADVAPVLAADSNPASPNNMQHMAVVKDFLLGP